MEEPHALHYRRRDLLCGQLRNAVKVFRSMRCKILCKLQSFAHLTIISNGGMPGASNVLAGNLYAKEL
jgi:hypothetical protein